LSRKENRALIHRKNLRIVGVDIDGDYVAAARAYFGEKSLENCVRIYQSDIYKIKEARKEFVLPHGMVGAGFRSDNVGEEGILFDAVMFSGTFAVLPDRMKALNLVKDVMKPDGRILIAQAYQRTTPPMARLFKRLLKYFTSIDHGELITEKEASQLLKNAVPKFCLLGMTKHEVIKDSIDNPLEAAYITILKPKILKKAPETKQTTD
jgi:SAM-dependent methyltransferase